MTDARDAARQKAEITYNSAADAFDAAPLAFWDRYGTRTVDRLRLRRGAHVLDACCGTGASALPAARAVGATGSVVAVDLADDLLALGRAKARAAELEHVDFRRGDMTALGFSDASFDAVVCVFGIFFVPDMEAAVAELWRMVRPGGQLAITTWGPDMFEPGYELFRAAVRRVRPDLVAAFHPWSRITTPQAVRELFAAARVPNVDVVAEAGHQPLHAREDFWTIARGSGLRWTIDRLGVEAARGVQAETLAALESRCVAHISTNVIYAVARRPDA